MELKILDDLVSAMLFGGIAGGGRKRTGLSLLQHHTATTSKPSATVSGLNFHRKHTRG